jgi:predicted RNA-binding protein with RPS1 domain
MDSPAMENAQEIKAKMKFVGKVMKISLAGAVVDIGIPQKAVIHVSQIVSADPSEPIKRVEDVMQIGQEVEVYVKRVRSDHIELTMIQPLELEWRDVKEGMTVTGKVVRLEKFGAFVEIGAERPGLVHISEMAHGYIKQPSDLVKEGDEVEAQVLEINRRKKQIKLSMKALVAEPEALPEAQKESSPPVEKDKDPRRGKRNTSKRQNEDNADSRAVDTIPIEPDPTVMEMAWQEAMRKAKASKRHEDKAKRDRMSSAEQEELLARTLEHKSRHS